MKNKRLLSVMKKWAIVNALSVSTIPIGSIIRILHLPTSHMNLYQLIAIQDSKGKVFPSNMQVMLDEFFPRSQPAFYVVRVNYDYNKEKYVPIDYNYYNSLEALPLNLYKEEWIAMEEVKESCVVPEKVI